LAVGRVYPPHYVPVPVAFLVLDEETGKPVPGAVASVAGPMPECQSSSTGSEGHGSLVVYVPCQDGRGLAGRVHALDPVSRRVVFGAAGYLSKAVAISPPLAEPASALSRATVVKLMRAAANPGAVYDGAGNAAGSPGGG
jgi:hypothetical protein